MKVFTFRRSARLAAAEPPNAELQHRRAKALRHFAGGLLLTLLLIFAKAAFEHCEPGRQLEQMTYSLLQLRLLAGSGLRDPGVVVVDITGLAPVASDFEGSTQLVTPRGPLLAIVRAIAEQGPRGIGIDLDFSPGQSGFVTREDPALLDALVDLRARGMPVFVGIFESVVREPAGWLGGRERQPLAAYISVPNPEHSEPAIRMMEWVRPAGVAIPCPSLATALSRAGGWEVSPLIRWAVRRATLSEHPEFSASEFLVDYAPLEKLIEGRVIAPEPSMIAPARDRIARRLVLVGKAAPGQTTDQFNVPGRGLPVPGVYVHAAATYTLLQAPLYRFTVAGRVAADALAALLVFVPIFAWQRFSAGRTGPAPDARRLELVLTSLVVFAVIVVGQVLVQRVRLMWTDSLMVVGALLLHGPSTRFFTWCGSLFRTAAGRISLVVATAARRFRKGAQDEEDT